MIAALVFIAKVAGAIAALFIIVALQVAGLLWLLSRMFRS